MILIIYWKNNKPFKLEISDSKTVLDLKQEIANHFGENYTGFKTSKQHKKNKEDFESDSDDDGRKKDREYGWNFIRK